ncbi:hypothetical protein [Halobacteriovorax sp.]|uniref:hypothetical protein n=1 Tax=Halobacteriovorax sp. TaxID=2020862 RepID=UPI0035675AAF
MLGKRSILIFLLSVNIFAQNSLTDELNELKSYSETVDLGIWTALSNKPQQKMIIEDSISASSSALKKEEIESKITEPAPEQQELGTIRYRSR